MRRLLDTQTGGVHVELALVDDVEGERPVLVEHVEALVAYVYLVVDAGGELGLTAVGDARRHRRTRTRAHWWQQRLWLTCAIDE